MDAQVLVMDDELEIANLVEVYLRSEGCTMFKCDIGTEALAMVRNQALGLAILNVMLPDISGLTLYEEVRKEHRSPVLMLTAKAEDMDKITDLTIGVGDYIARPFNPLELIARVKAQSRRYIRYNEADKTDDCQDIIDFNGLVINRVTHEYTLYGRELGLAPIEFDILWMLCENRGRVISAEWLSESVWGEKYLDRNDTVTVHICRLRERMDESSCSPRFIKTI